MLNFKKIAMLGMAAMMAVSAMSVSAFAYDLPSWSSVDENGNAMMAVDGPDGTIIDLPTWDEAYAYLDYNTAPAEVKEQILEARSNIVYAPDSKWTVNGQLAVIDADGTVESLPEFSDVFPSDWNLNDITAKYEENLQTSMSRAAGFSNMVDVPAQSDNYSNEFYQFTATNSSVAAWASTMPTGATINFGYRNMDTGKDVGWAGNLAKGQKCYLYNAVKNVRYGVRCSSGSGAFSAYIVVRDV